jgi:hypothetical protein
MTRKLRSAASAFAVLIAVAGLVSTPARPAAADVATPPASGSGSATTLSGTGAFSSLAVTVSQTQNLINQDVSVSWTGGTQTVPQGSFYADYLQIMQCWGDDLATGPDPAQCEFGVVRATASTGGLYTATRQITYNPLVDPAETDVPAGYSGDPTLSMPFDPAPDTALTGRYVRPPLTADNETGSDYYDQADTNEIDYARTAANGTGHEYFEMDTAREAPGLGCGQSVPDPADGGRAVAEPCWLVIVPRGDTEVDGTTRSGDTANSGLVSSPLSATNWAHRIAFPLTFEPVASACAIGANEVQTSGDEQLSEAMASWQPGLCAQNPTNPYGFSLIGDDEARAQLSSGGDPGLAFISDPLVTPSGQPPPDVLYAPVAVSALTISFYIQSQALPGTPGASQNGIQITQLNLNARLLAKLLTQSYQQGVARSYAPGLTSDPPIDVPKQNPVDLTTDPEFLTLNPQFKGLDFSADSIPDITVPFGNADAFSELWTWIDNDPAAHAFLTGTPDNTGPYGNPAYSGMTVNPNYLDMQLPVEDFPITDPYCQPTVPQFVGSAGSVNQQTPLCGLALHPYVTTMQDGALDASEGNQALHTTWTVGPESVGSWTAATPEPDGQIAILALADAATAAKYDLPTARLCNDEVGAVSPTGAPTPTGGAKPTGTPTPTGTPSPNGGTPSPTCTAPTTQTLQAALADAEPSSTDPSVLIPNPNTVDPEAYPLTTITYAATVPSGLTPTEGDQYAKLLDYVAGPGQVPGLAPGDLAPGYAPLPTAMANQTVAAARTLETQAGVPVAPTATPPTGSSGIPPGGADETAFPEPTLTLPSPAPRDLPTGPATGRVIRATVPAGNAAAETPLTPAEPLGAIRYVLLICLLLAGLSAGAGPGLLIYARRVARRWNPRG